MGEIAIHFIRRVYFLRETGEAILFFHRYGEFIDTTVEQDWAEQHDLQPFLQRQDEIDVLEWTLPDPAVEAVFDAAAWVRVERDGGSYVVVPLLDFNADLEEPDSDATLMQDILEGRL